MLKKTVSTWSSAEAMSKDHPMHSLRDAWIEKAYEEGKTDGVVTDRDVGTLTSTRRWADQAAAEEWVAFVTALTEEHGYTVSLVIEDNV